MTNDQVKLLETIADYDGDCFRAQLQNVGKCQICPIRGLCYKMILTADIAIPIVHHTRSEIAKDILVENVLLGLEEPRISRVNSL